MKEGWTKKRMDEVCSIARGGSPRPIKDYITNDSNGLNWIKIGDTDMGGKYIYSTKEKIKPEGLKKSRWVEEDEFLLSNSMSFGRPYILKTNGCIHDGWLVLRDYQKYLKIEFFYYVLSSEYVQRQFRTKAQGSTVSNLNTDRVASVTIPVPPLSEQQSVVDYLDSAFAKIDAMKANAEKALNEAKALFQASLKEMLEPKEGWEEKTLKETCSVITDGTHHSPVNTANGKYKYVTAKNIKPWGLDLRNITFVSEDVHKEIVSRCCPQKGDVLYIKDGATTGIAIVNPLDEEFSLLSSVALIRPNKNIMLSEYLCYALNSPSIYEQTRSQMDGAAITRVTLVKIKGFTIPLPPLSEQQSIVATLDSLKSKVYNLQENCDKISLECDALKQAILRQVFE